LQAPVRRVNFPDTPTPCSPVLEEAYYPGSKSIKRTIKHLCGIKNDD
jgi:pyruvate/2-oxoglutarate/acetoin dehydrogenase E1 component